MSEQPPQDPNAPRPGWYPDLADQTLLRWWDGRGWTAQTQPMPGTSAPQPPWPGQPGSPVPPSGHGRKSWPARHKVLTGLIAFAALIIAATAAGASGNGDTAATAPQNAAGPASVPASATAPQAPASSDVPPPSPSPSPATKVEFVVSGYAPDGVDITYGPSGTNLSGPTTLDGTATMSVPFDSNAEFYALNAQLQGDGHITCKIVATGPGDKPLTVSHGAASGGYNICSAQATTDDGLSWQDEN